MNAKKIVLSTVSALTLMVSSFVPAQAGSNSPGVENKFAPANTRITYDPVTFYKGQTAVVRIEGTGRTDLDLYVYDASGNLIDKDDDNSDVCVATWTPRWTGNFTIVVINRGSVGTYYSIATN